jgi:hypothetical protein
MAKKRSEALHIIGRQVGGSERPVVNLSDGRTLELRNDVPGKRSQCPTQRPCPHVRCEMHLWFVAGEDRAGRRHGGRQPPSTLRPAWMESPLPASCTLDVLESRGGVPLSGREVAAFIPGEGNMRRASVRTVELVTKRAVAKLRAVEQPELDDFDRE